MAAQSANRWNAKGVFRGNVRGFKTEFSSASF